MLFKNSFYKKSLIVFILIIFIFAAVFVVISKIFFDNYFDKDISSDFVSYERYVKNYIDEFKNDILSAANALDLKNFTLDKNNGNIQSFFDFYLEKENAPDAIYLFDNDNNCVFFSGYNNKEDEALKFIADKSDSDENVYISDFFDDNFNNENHILFGKNIYLGNLRFKLAFCYNNQNFRNLFIDDDEGRIFSVILPTGDTLTDYSEYGSENRLFSSIDFMEIMKVIKLKTFKSDFENGESGKFYFDNKNGSILINYKTSSFPYLIFVSIEQNKNDFNQMLLYTCCFSVIFIFIILTVYSLILRNLLFKLKNSEYEIENINFSIRPPNLSKTKIQILDLYINKISELCNGYKGVFNDIKKMALLFNTNIGAFEIFGKEGIVLYSSEISDIVGSSDINKLGEVNNISVENFFKFKNNNWIKFEKEQDVYCVKINDIKKWIKVFYYDENNTRCVVIDISNYIVKKYKNAFDSDFDYVTGLLKKESFIERAGSYIKNNKLSFGCLASLELSYYPTIYDIYGEYISNEYLRTAVSYFSSLFDGFFAGVKKNGEFMIFIYSENSKEDIKSKFEVWENKTSQNLFIAPNGKKFKFKFIIGYACYPTDAEDFDTLLKYSDFALYETKKFYKEAVHSFALENYNRDMFIEIRTKALDKLIDENTASYHFQPIVNVKDCSVYGYEALLRTNDNVFSNPIDIVNIAITEGKSYLFEKMNVLNCMEIVKKNKTVFGTKRLFINSIATSSLTEEDLRAIKTNYLDIRHLIVYEISTLFSDNVSVINKCELFKKNNEKYAIDRFGGKYTDDNSLLNTNPEYVKIDKSLISDIHLKKEKQSHVMKVVKFAKENNIIVIAVGIETYDELLTVMRLGIEFVQGFYISLPKDNFMDEIRDNLKKEIAEIKSNNIII